MSRWKSAYGRVAARVVKGVARLNGAPERSLTEDERALAQPIFRSSLDLSRVRVREEITGLLNISRSAFAIEETIYFPRGWSPVAKQTFVHELVHVWQFQNGGHAYIADAVHAQTLGDGYDLELGLTQGRKWDQLNAEQQATFIEEGFAHGCVDQEKSFLLRGRDWTEAWRLALAELRAGRGATFSPG